MWVVFMEPSKKLYPLQFKEIIRSYEVGGTKIQDKYNKNLPEDGKIAETWEISDHDADISIVSNGPFSGKHLRGLIWEFKEELLGDRVYSKFGMRFPLLVKFIDATENLTVQMHPDDELAHKLNLDHNGKAEVYYILEAEKDSVIYWGCKEGVTETEMIQAVQTGNGLELAKEIPVQSGDTIFVPPKWVHAIGEGNLVLEIQQNADITFEPTRVKKTIQDKTYELFHGKEAENIFTDHMLIRSVDSSEAKIPSITTQEDKNKRKLLFASNYFALESLILEGPWDISLDGENFVVLNVVKGSGSIDYRYGDTNFEEGDTILIPAGMSDFTIEPTTNSQVLKTFIPDLKADIFDPLKKRGVSEKTIVRLGGYREFNDLLSFL